MFYLVPLELQACPVWCKIPQFRANNLSSGESDEDLGIGNLPSSCFLHNCEVDGDLSTVGGVPADRTGRSEPGRVTEGNSNDTLGFLLTPFPSLTEAKTEIIPEGMLENHWYCSFGTI